MTYEQIKKLKAREFKRLCGVKPQLFNSHYARLNVIRKITENLAIAMSQEALTQIK